MALVVTMGTNYQLRIYVGFGWLILRPLWPTGLTRRDPQERPSRKGRPSRTPPAESTRPQLSRTWTLELLANIGTLTMLACPGNMPLRVVWVSVVVLPRRGSKNQGIP